MVDGCMGGSRVESMEIEKWMYLQGRGVFDAQVVLHKVSFSTW